MTDEVFDPIALVDNLIMSIEEEQEAIKLTITHIKKLHEGDAVRIREATRIPHKTHSELTKNRNRLEILREQFRGIIIDHDQMNDGNVYDIPDRKKRLSRLFTKLNEPEERRYWMRYAARLHVAGQLWQRKYSQLVKFMDGQWDHIILNCDTHKLEDDSNVTL